MRRTFSLTWVIASDVACIFGGFIAAVMLIQLLQTASSPIGAIRSLEVQQSTSASPVNSGRKGDRLDVVPLADRLSDAFGPPAEHSISVPKGAASSAQPSRRKIDPLPPQQSEDARKRKPSPIETIGCESLGSPIVDPVLSRYAGRCLVQLDRSLRRSANS